MMRDRLLVDSNVKFTVLNAFKTCSNMHNISHFEFPKSVKHPHKFDNSLLHLA